MSPDDEEDEGLGTSGEIRARPEDAEAQSAAHREALASREGEASREVYASPPARTGYAVYGDFIKDELEVQDKRKASFEQRGLAVITTSGALVTLLFALAALSTKQAATFALPDAARTWLSVSLVLFLASALAALLSNAPFIYQAVPAHRIRERLRDAHPRDADEAAKDVAFTRPGAQHPFLAFRQRGHEYAPALVIEGMRLPEEARLFARRTAPAGVRPGR